MRPVQPVVDAHHHIWRQADLPWLSGPMLPRIFGPYEPIRRDYAIAEYLDDIADSGVVASVYVQANWPRDQAEDEVRWVSEISADAGWPQAIVGYCDLVSDDAPQVLQALARYPLMRGIRMQLHWHQNEMYRFESVPDRMSDAVFRRHLALLGDYGWTFDLQVFASQMASAARLAAEFPETTFVLQHCGMPEDMGAAGRAQWHEGMQRLADQGNVACKLSGLGTFIHRNDPAHIAEVVSESVALFGPERCLFGSNFPIEKLWCAYGDLMTAYRQVLSAWNENEQRQMLHDTAARVYRLDTEGQPAATPVASWP